MSRLLPAIILTLFLLLPSGCAPSPDEDAAPASVASSEAAFSVVVFSRTDGYRHASIDDGLALLRTLGQQHSFRVQATEDPERLTGRYLSEADVVVFLNTSETVFDTDAQREQFRAFVEAGGGFVGVHAAADTEYDWPWYGQLIGAYFDGHPAVQEARLDVVDDGHPSTAHLPNPWVRTDEWYSYRDVQEGLTVLLNLDEDTYDLEDTPAMGDEHPIAWYHTVGEGRSWYTGLGHTADAYTEEAFQEHLLGGLRWAAGQEE